MKYPEITFQTVLRAFRRQWKAFVLSVLLFALLGVGAGFVFSEKAAAPAAGGAAPLEEADFDEITASADYYADCKDYLFERQKDAVNYVQELAADRTITGEQRAVLNEQLLLLQEYKDTVLDALQAAWSVPDALYIPDEFLDSETARYESLAASIRLSLISAEAAVDLLKTMDSPDVGTDDINKAYASLLSSAAQYGPLKVSLTRYEAALSQLEEHTDEIIAQSRWLNGQLNAAKREFNQLQTEVCQVLDSIARENSLLLAADSTGNDLSVTIAHTHTLATAQEAFAILVIFCTLVGVCGGAFFIVCREAKRGVKETEQA